MNINLEELYFIWNGGPGSGNHNPGQGRGVGKPSKRSKKISYEEYIDKFKKSTRSEKRELDKEYPEYADRYFDELMGRHLKTLKREREQKELEEKFKNYEKDNSHPHFDLDNAVSEFKSALDISPNEYNGDWNEKEKRFEKLKNLKEYYNKNKDVEVKVYSVSPLEYSKIIIENNKNHNYKTMQDVIRRTSEEGIDMYVKKFEKGDRVEVPYIKFDKEGNYSGEQEGFHRTFAADRVNDKEIPIFIVQSYSGKKPQTNYGRDITKDVENYYLHKNTNNNKISQSEITLNGGKGSGNHNPGQGRGVGKPANRNNTYKKMVSSANLTEEEKRYKKYWEDYGGEYIVLAGSNPLDEGYEDEKYEDEKLEDGRTFEQARDYFDSMIRKRKFPEDTTVYRRLQFPTKSDLEKAIKNSFVWDAPQATSSTLNPKFLKDSKINPFKLVEDENCLILKINVKKGQSGLALDNSMEEIILPRYSEFKIKKEDEKIDGITTYVVDYVEHETKENLNSLSFQVNGGPNSGNHNPGQGRGKGKPNNSLSKIIDSYKEKYSDFWLNGVGDNGFETATKKGAENYKNIVDLVEKQKDIEWNSGEYDRMTLRIAYSQDEIENNFKTLCKNNLTENDFYKIKNLFYDWSTNLGPRGKDGLFLDTPGIILEKDSEAFNLYKAYIQTILYESGITSKKLFRGEPKKFDNKPKQFVSYTDSMMSAVNFARGNIENVIVEEIPINKIIAVDDMMKFSGYRTEKEWIVDSGIYE